MQGCESFRPKLFFWHHHGVVSGCNCGDRSQIGYGIEFKLVLRCYLVTVMGLVIPWSITLIVVDAYSVFIKRLPRQPKILLVIIVGDLVLSYLLLAAASSTASVTTVLLAAGGCTAKPCSRYQLSAAMAFFSWFLSLASSLFNLWLLPSL
nr:CASP-like protein 5C1 isoform X2 [Quercus suber]